MSLSTCHYTIHREAYIISFSEKTVRNPGLVFTYLPDEVSEGPSSDLPFIVAGGGETPQ